jgi:glycosyltransferase involved in cell wall biosynthesis
MPALPTLSPVSVVIPAYNYADFVGLAIQSVLQQDHADFELLVVDDGSTDGTAALVTSFSDPRIRYIHQANAGLSAARNTGIRQARHPLIAFLDADDEWLPTHLSTATAVFARLDPSFALVAAGGSRIDRFGNALSAYPGIARDREVPVADIVLKTRFMPSAVVVRREAFAECGLFDTALRSSEDRDMWIRIGRRHRLFKLAAITTHIRKHSDNMSKQADRMRASMKTVLARAYEARVVPRWHYSFWLKAWALYFLQSAWMLHDAGRGGEAVRDAFLAIGICPWPLSSAALNERALFRLRALLRFTGKLLIPR